MESGRAAEECTLQSISFVIFHSHGLLKIPCCSESGQVEALCNSASSGHPQQNNFESVPSRNNIRGSHTFLEVKNFYEK